MGSIYLRGNTYWLKYYQNGKMIRESSGSEKKMVAKELLKKREGEITQGKLPGIHFDKVFFNDLVEIILRDYKLNNKKSLSRAELSVKHLREFFESIKVNDISTADINRYIERRLDQQASNGTVNRELSALRRMMSLGSQQSPPLVDRIPQIVKLKERNVRTGFFEHNDFLKIREVLPEYVKGLVTFAYKTGWRLGEILSLTWSQVDRNNWIVRLEVGTTKNDEGRVVFLDSELKEIFKQQWDTQKKYNTITPFVFPNKKRDGKIDNFRKAWNSAFKNAGLPKKLFHDLRRTAVRNMIRAGIPEVVAMKISGHKTRSVFDRYNIVNEKDLQMASEKQEKYLSSGLGTVSGTIVNLNKKKELPING